MNIRHPAVASQFYPGNAALLKQAIFSYLEKVSVEKVAGLKAIISPHAGYIYSGPIAAYGYKTLKFLDQSKKWKVLLIGPSHHVPFYGAAVAMEEEWETPLGMVEVADLRKEIGEKDSLQEIPEANVGEHSLEVQVPFLQMMLSNFILYPLVLGNLRSDTLAEDLKEFCAQEDVIVVVSSDLSHYLPYEEAMRIDKNTCNAIKDLNVKKMDEEGDACGKTGILTLMHIAKNLGWKPKLLDYRNSGDTAGDKSGVVGYSSFVFLK